MADREEIAKALGYLAMLYPSYRLSRETIQAYLTILGDLPADLVIAAAQHLGSTSTFFPAAAEIRKAAFGLIEQSSDIPTSYEAWQQVKVLRREMHPLTKEAIDLLGGMRAFGASDMSEESSWRARFIACYEQLVERRRYEQRMLPDVQRFTSELGSGQMTGAIEGLVNKLRLPPGNKEAQDWDL